MIKIKAKLLGIQTLDFSPDKGDPIKGIKLFFSYESRDKNTLGQFCDKVYISDSNKDLLTIDPLDFIDNFIDLDFDRNGKLQCVSA